MTLRQLLRFIGGGNLGWIYEEGGAQAGCGMYRCQELNHSGLVQAFSTKKSGNMALHTGGNPHEVITNRLAFLGCLGLEMGQLTAAGQTHSVNIQVVEGSAAGRGAGDAADAFPDTDALLTRVPGVVLSIFTADCLPLFIYDPVTPAVGIVHAGWRGTIAGIVCLSIAKMNETFGTDPTQCRVAIGPGIGPECFQVSPELAMRFQEECPDSVIRNEDHIGVDLFQFNVRLLQEVGIPPQQIFSSHECTCCHPETFFSYRASGAGNGSGECNGRMMGLIALQP